MSPWPLALLQLTFIQAPPGEDGDNAGDEPWVVRSEFRWGRFKPRCSTKCSLWQRMAKSDNTSLITWSAFCSPWRSQQSAFDPYILIIKAWAKCWRCHQELLYRLLDRQASNRQGYTSDCVPGSFQQGWTCLCTDVYIYGIHGNGAGAWNLLDIPFISGMSSELNRSSTQSCELIFDKRCSILHIQWNDVARAFPYHFASACQTKCGWEVHGGMTFVTLRGVPDSMQLTRSCYKEWKWPRLISEGNVWWNLSTAKVFSSDHQC